MEGFKEIVTGFVLFAILIGIGLWFGSFGSYHPSAESEPIQEEVCYQYAGCW